MSDTSKRRILNVLGSFTPSIRQLASSLNDLDMVLVEEAFEHLLLVGIIHVRLWYNAWEGIR